MVYVIIIWYLVINVVSFVIYGADKKKAERGQWRIPEATLLLTGALGGGVGSALAMKSFRHKTKKPIFLVLVPVLIILHCFIVAVLFSTVLKNF